MTGADPRWTDAENATLVKLVKDGVGVPEIARQLGRARNTIRQRCHRLGLGLRPVRLLLPRGEVVPRIRTPVVFYPPGTCTWMEGHRPNWHRCTEKVWRHSSWCHAHYRIVYSYRRDIEYEQA